jgi:hypothetical protein
MWARIRDRRRRLQDEPLPKESSPRRDSISAGLAQFENADLRDMKVRVDTKRIRGAYGIVLNAVGSEIIESEVSVGALWTSLPDLTFMPFPGDGYPEVVQIIPDLPHDTKITYADRKTLNTAFTPPFTPTNASIFLDPRHTPTDGTDDCLGLLRGDLTREEARKFFDAFAPAYRYEMERYLRPSASKSERAVPACDRGSSGHSGTRRVAGPERVRSVITTRPLTRCRPASPPRNQTLAGESSAGPEAAANFGGAAASRP